MELGTTLLLVALLGALLLLLALGGGKATKGPLPPGPLALPIVGNLLQISPFRMPQSLIKLSQRYGPVFLVRLGQRPVLVLAGHKAVREALVENAEVFAGRGRMPTIEPVFNGHGVVFSNGDRWRQLRRFSLTVLRDFGMGRKSIEGRIQEEAQFMLQELHRTKGEPFDPTFLLSSAVSNVICSIVFGSRFHYQDETFLGLLRMINETFRELSTPWSQLYDMMEDVLKYVPGPHRKIPKLLGRMRAFIARRVESNAQSLDPDNPRDFIDCFLIQMQKEQSQPSTEFTQENLELTTLNLFFAGTETVSSTLRYGFLQLMKHPEVQEKVHQEIEKVVGLQRAPAVQDRGRMPYTDAVIHEIQRCADLLPVNVPHTTTRDTLFRGYFIPKGTDVYPLLGTAMRDPCAFRSPEAFDPGNFLDGSGRFQKNEAFVPFSSGKRLCLGESLARMELFLFLSTILQRFRLQPLVPAPEVPTDPVETGFANIPPFYKLRVVPRG